MRSLTVTAYHTRRMVNFGIIALVAFIVLRIVLGFAINTVRFARNQQAAKPDHKLGQLQALNFPPSDATSSAELTFRVGTVDGTIPVASTSATVYFMPKDRPNLLDLPNARSLAAQLGFTGDPIQRTESEYVWRDTTDPLRTMRMEIFLKQLTVSYEYQRDLSVFDRQIIKNRFELIEDATDFLRRNQLLPFDIDPSLTQVTYLRLLGTELVQTEVASQAHAAQINFFRSAVDKTPSTTPDPDRGIISITLTAAADPKRQVIELLWRHWPVAYRSFGRYELISSQQAWEQLQQGNGYFARMRPGIRQVVVRDVYLAYYDSYDEQLFYQPVFVFEGDDDFVGYVPAVAPPWSGTTASQR